MKQKSFENPMKNVRLFCLGLVVILLLLPTTSNAQIQDSIINNLSIDGYFYFRPDLDFNHRNPDFPVGNSSFNFFLRSDLGVSYKLGRNVIIKTTIQSFGTYTQNLGELDAEVKLFEAYAEMKNINGSNFNLKFGRFSLGEYGSGMIIGDRDFYNGRSFESVRVRYEKPKFVSDFLWVQLYQTSPNTGEFLHPILFINQNKFKISENNTVNAYLYYLVDVRSDPYRTYTFFPGISWNTKFNRIHFDIEINPQIGKLRPVVDDGSTPKGTISAYGLETGILYILNESKETSIGLQYYRASGDDDLSDNKKKSFNPFWQEEHPRFGHIDLFRGSNIQVFTLGFKSSFKENLKYGFNVVNASVLQLLDPSPGLLKSGKIDGISPESGTNIGSGIDLHLTYYYTSGLSFGFNYSIFKPGSYIVDNSEDGDMIHRFYVHCSTRF